MRKQKQAFTLIELLVVVALIAALVGILAVGQQKVKYHARTLKQKAEFHGMDISLELFHSDFREYPDSDVVSQGGVNVCGAQRLAEAMVGRDERGFHPKSKWHPGLETPEDYYMLTSSPTQEEVEANLTQRTGPYFELKHTGVSTLNDMWGNLTGAAGSLQSTQCPVLTDVFTFNKVTNVAGKNIKVGSPVLYFKAEPTKRFRVDATNREAGYTPAEYRQWVYDLTDNLEILNLNWLREDGIAGNTKHYTTDPENPSAPPAAAMNAKYFYQQITARERSSAGADFFKPQNKETFILISAGWDGIFGTKDDVMNFDN